MSIHNSKLNNLVTEGDISKIRSFLLNIIDASPDMSDGDFERALTYIEEKLGASKLYDSFTGEFIFEIDRRLWDKRYMAKITLVLRKEFSKKLVDHIQEVGRLVYGGIDPVKKLKMAEGHQYKTEKYKKKQEVVERNPLLIVLIVATVIVILFLMKYI